MALWGRRAFASLRLKGLGDGPRGCGPAWMGTSGVRAGAGGNIVLRAENLLAARVFKMSLPSPTAPRVFQRRPRAPVPCFFFRSISDGRRPLSLSAGAWSIFGRGGNGEKEKLSLQDIAELIRSGACQRVVAMVGAGISTPSGIPDFSPFSLWPRSSTLGTTGPMPHTTSCGCCTTRGCFYGCTHRTSTGSREADVMADRIPHCPVCSGLVKPDIVFFGEPLPPRFLLHVVDFPMADLLLILGTSLEVEPFASLSEAVRSSVPRLLINRHLVGPLAWCPRSKDVTQLGDVVHSVERLVELLGWTEEMQDLMQRETGKFNGSDR
ncbi:NAD-dependent protein deacetylase sirtuin-3, mitochondrial isoform X3 [Tupaia chinensis]|uniref:NAD-dependent protein deacetylase sirtuin-3, mitochondrial isoform X3 n=1 Tax=Tupaia chinensis TaxID=246437 RepID=UPI000FFC7F78|nr:NAD-dependent protein deacetylase sirtuin-3, mitochondrial isoform X3 [Tupaia chinensis]